MALASVSSYDIKNIELSDKPFFEKAYSSLSMPLADQDFSMIYIWNSIINAKWSSINKNLCIFADFNSENVIWGPVIGGKKLHETMDMCFSIIGEGGKLLYLPEELHSKYSNLSGYSVFPQNQDYVYNIKDLIELKGGKYGKKRNMINYFLSNYNPIVEDFSPARHKKGCLQLLELWKRQKKESGAISKSVKFQFDTEIALAKETIKLADALPLKGIVVMVDGKIQGMSFGSPLNQSTCSIIVEKTNHCFKGLSEFIFNAFLKRSWKDFSFVNAQEDMGVEYIRSSKLSYHPSMLVKSYTVMRE